MRVGLSVSSHAYSMVQNFSLNLQFALDKAVLGAIFKKANLIFHILLALDHIKRFVCTNSYSLQILFLRVKGKNCLLPVCLEPPKDDKLFFPLPFLIFVTHVLTTVSYYFYSISGISGIHPVHSLLNVFLKEN